MDVSAAMLAILLMVTTPPSSSSSMSPSRLSSIHLPSKRGLTIKPTSSMMTPSLSGLKPRPNLLTVMLIDFTARLRGGDFSVEEDSDEDENINEMEDDYDDHSVDEFGTESDEEEQNEDDDQQQQFQYGQQQDDDDNDDKREVEDILKEDTASATATDLSAAVKVIIRTNMQCSVLDQKLELTASTKRTIDSLKQAISKTMSGRPPPSCLILKHHGRILYDQETVNDILINYDDDDEDEQEEEVAIREREPEDEDMIQLKLTLDILPPIDAKFALELKHKTDQLSTKQLMNAYCINVAGMMYGIELGKEEMEDYYRELQRVDHSNDNSRITTEQKTEKNVVDEGSSTLIHSDGSSGAKNYITQNQSLNIRRRAAFLQKQMEHSLPENIKQLIEEEDGRVKAYLKGLERLSPLPANENTELSREAIFGLNPVDESAHKRHGKKGRILKVGGATMNVKRVVQRNMNINWADTTRTSLLFLFFGYFGGRRNSFSRTFLLLASPLCFLIQTRPVKIALKQLFYAIGEPPGILLSLLPAPQQAIMSLNYNNVMRDLYGEDILKKESWTLEEELEEDFNNGEGSDEDEFEYDIEE